MNIKSKIALAAVVAAGAVALPSAAQAQQVEIGGTPIPTSPTTAITGDGSLTLNAAGGFKVTCNVHVSGSVWNDASGLGRNSISSITFSPTPCPTNVPTCFATASAVSASLPWASALLYDGLLVRDKISGVSFTNTFSGTCPAGLPTRVPLSESGSLSRSSVAVGC